MVKNYLKILTPLVLAALMTMPAGAEEPDGPADIPAAGADAGTPLVFDAKGVARPAASYEQVQEKPAPEKKKEKGKKRKEETQDTGISPENPMYVTADRMRYNDTTGDVDAMGRVVIKHMMDTYQTEYVYGNSIAQKYVIPGEVKWVNPTTNLKADRADYDAAKSIGRFEKLDGWEQGTYYFKGASGIYDRNANKLVVEKGYFTTKHAVAKVPDYRIEADSIDIYPNDHYVAHNVKLMAKNTTLITLSSYSGSLAHDDNEVSLWSLIPRPVFDSDNGMGLHNEIAVPFGGNANGTVYVKNRWYTKSGYKPDMGVRYRTPVGTAKLHYAEEESSTNDDGGIWVKKRPSLEFDTNHFYLGKSRFYVGAHGEWGYWDEDRGGRDVKGAYKGYDLYVSGNPWKLGKFMNFSWKAGYAKDYYSYSNNIRRNGYYSMGLSGGYGILSSWIYYTDRDIKGYTPYTYDSYSSEKPLDVGFRLQATRMDAFSLAWSIDTVNGRLNHRYWTYYRDMHSFYAWIRYDDIEKETRFMFMPKDFRF